MQIEQLILFSKIVEEKNISSAAKLCHISQPAASKQMQRLEEELDVQLFIRNNWGIELTQAGQAFSEYAFRMVDMHDVITDKMKEWKYQREIVQIVACPTVAHYVIPCTLCSLKKSNNQIAFNIQAMPSVEVVDHINADLADVGFTMNKPNSKNLNITDVFDDEIVLVAGAHHPIPDAINIENIDEYFLVLPHERFEVYKRVSSVFVEKGYDIEGFEQVQKFSSIEAIKSLVTNCCGIAFLPKRVVRQDIQLGTLRVIDIVGFKLEYTMYAIYKEGVFPNKSVKQIIESIN